MDQLRALLAEIAARPNCRLLPPAGRPAVDHELPVDLAVFFDACGGAWLREGDGDALPWRVSGPAELVPAAPRLLTPDIAREAIAEDPDGLAATTYVLADNGGMSTDMHVIVDLHPARLGEYRDAFWDTYPVPSDMPVVATTLAGALRWMLFLACDDD